MLPATAAFVSDVHIGPDTPKRTKLFLRFLKTLPGRVHRLYLLGDLFDSWIGPRHPHFPDAHTVLDTLAQISHAGVEITFVPGNRDFFLAPTLQKLLGPSQTTGTVPFTDLVRPGGQDRRRGPSPYASRGQDRRRGLSPYTSPDALIVTLDHLRFHLSHGDVLCTRDVRNLRLRRILRSSLFGRFFTTLPAELALYLANCLRLHSTRVVRAKHHAVVSIDPRQVRTLFLSGIDVVVCGHVHRSHSSTLELDGRTCRLFVLEDWTDRGAWLEYAHGEFTRREIGPD